MTMGDRMAILKDGVLQQIGAPKDVYRHRVNEFVGGFVGSPSMNFIDVLARPAGDAVALESEDGSFRYQTESATIDTETQLTAGIRPEDVHVVDTEGIDATVDVVEPVGSDNYIHLDRRLVCECSNSGVPAVRRQRHCSDEFDRVGDRSRERRINVEFELGQVTATGGEIALSNCPHACVVGGFDDRGVCYISLCPSGGEPPGLSGDVDPKS